MVALSKTDLVPAERRRAHRRGLARAARRLGRPRWSAISSATGAGLDELRRAISARLPEAAARGRGPRRVRGRAPRLPPRRGRGLRRRRRGRGPLARHGPRHRAAGRAPRPLQRGGPRLPRGAPARDRRHRRASARRIRARRRGGRRRGRVRAGPVGARRPGGRAVRALQVAPPFSAGGAARPRGCSGRPRRTSAWRAGLRRGRSRP